MDVMCMYYNMLKIGKVTKGVFGIKVGQLYLKSYSTKVFSKY